MGRGYHGLSNEKSPLWEAFPILAAMSPMMKFGTKIPTQVESR